MQAAVCQTTYPFTILSASRPLRDTIYTEAATAFLSMGAQRSQVTSLRPHSTRP